MKFSQEDLKSFYKVIDIFESNLETTHACVSLKVLYHFMKNTSTTIRFELQSSVFEHLEHRNYSEYDPMVYEDLRRGFRIMAEIVQERNYFSDEFEDDFPDGVFAVPASKDEPKIKLRALLNYCKKVGKSVSELTAEELEPFYIENTLNRLIDLLFCKKIYNEVRWHVCKLFRSSRNRYYKFNYANEGEGLLQAVAIQIDKCISDCR